MGRIWLVLKLVQKKVTLTNVIRWMLGLATIVAIGTGIIWPVIRDFYDDYLKSRRRWSESAPRQQAPLPHPTSTSEQPDELHDQPTQQQGVFGSR